MEDTDQRRIDSGQHSRLDDVLSAAQSVQVELPGPFSPGLS
jgi:hypothetical protein